MFSFRSIDEFNLGNEGAVSYKKTREVYKKLHGNEEKDANDANDAKDAKDGKRGVGVNMGGIAEVSEDDAQRWLLEKIEAIDGTTTSNVGVTLKEFEKDGEEGEKSSERKSSGKKVGKLAEKMDKTFYKELKKLAVSSTDENDFINNFKRVLKDQKNDLSEDVLEEFYKEIKENESMIEKIQYNLNSISSSSKERNKWTLFETKLKEYENKEYTASSEITRLIIKLYAKIYQKLDKQITQGVNPDWKKIDRKTPNGKKLSEFVIFLLYTVSDFSAEIYNIQNIEKLISELNNYKKTPNPINNILNNYSSKFNDYKETSKRKGRDGRS